MEIIWVMGFFFLFCTVLFIAIAVFLPEWVGITGKRAKQIRAHQHELPPEEAPATKTTDS